jgi:hypothetical protein
VRILDLFKTFFGSLMRNERGAGVFEGFTTRYMVEVVVTVYHVPDRLIADLLDFLKVSGRRLRPSIAGAPP